MAQRRITVGQTPVLLANDRRTRAAINISMVPTSIEAGNTGIVYVGKGFIPSSVSGAANTGDPIVQGTQITDAPQFDGDPSLFQGQWWAISDTAGQVIIVDESIK